MKKLGSRAIVKPLDDKGGAGIFALALGDPNLPPLLEMATVKATRPVMIQRYAPVEKYGDKRILLLDGEVLGAFTRRPSKGDVRANISAGGTLHKASLTTWDKRLVAAISPDLRRRGLHFVGLDVIGNNLTEINVTSPAGIADLIILERKHTEGRVADFIESKIGI
jgi:glutathione synthase